MQSAIDNLAGQWLYQQNPLMQVGLPHRQAGSATSAGIPAGQAQQLSSFVTTSEVFGVNDALFFEYAQMTLAQTTDLTGGVQVVTGSLMVRATGGSNPYPVAQLLTTGLVIPDVSFAGFGVNAVLAQPPTGVLVLMRDLVDNDQIASVLPNKLDLLIFLNVKNGTSGAVAVNSQFTFKWRHISGVTNEG